MSGAVDTVSRTVSPRLIGRAAELDRVVAAVSSLPAVVVVEGEAGIGKTRLLSELQSRPEVATLQLVSGSCRPIREAFPLGPMVEALRGVAAEIRGDRLSPVAGSLRPLVPELADRLPPPPDPLDDRLAERHRVFRGLIEVLDELGPVLLVVEDLHWADEQTVDFLRYLLADARSGLGVVVTYRSEEIDSDTRALTARLPREIGHVHLTLRALDVAETGELAAAILETERVSTEFAANLCERASGVPFAVEELLALLRARGTLVRHRHGWARRALDELEVPASIRDSVLERLGRLSKAGQSVVAAAAVLQTPVPLEVLTATCAGGSARITDGLSEAFASGLLVERDEGVGFRHVLAAQAVYDDLALPQRVELHGRTADALSELQPTQLGQIAHHQRHAGRTTEWAVAAERAAQHAVDLGHEDEAVRLLADLLRNATLPSPERGRLAVLLGSAAARSGRASEAVDVLTAALDGADDLDRSVRGELRFWLAMLLHVEGHDAARSHRLWVAAVDDLVDRPGLRAWTLANLAMPIVPDVDMAEHLGWLRRARDALEAVEDRTTEVFLAGKVAMVQTVVGDPEWRTLTDRIIRLTDGVPRNRREVSAYHSVGVDACYAGHHQESGRLLAAAYEGAVACGSEQPALYVRASRALLDFCVGAWERLDAELASLVDALVDDWVHQVNVVLVKGCLALARGDFEVANAQLREQIKESAPIDGDLLPIRTAALIRLDLANRDFEAATTTAQRFLTRLEAKPMWSPATRALPATTLALVTTGQIAEAAARIHQYADALDGLDAPLAVPTLEHARGIVAAGRGSHDAAASQLRAAGDEYERVGSAYEAAQAREAAARAMFAGELDDAAAVLRAAIATYDKLGATWDIDRASRLARTRGIRLPSHRGGSKGYGAELSPREREVARLAAIGRTNREIAEQLYLSPNTVKRHLSAAMRKLEVGSRTALAHRLANDLEARRD